MRSATCGEWANWGRTREGGDLHGGRRSRPGPQSRDTPRYGCVSDRNQGCVPERNWHWKLVCCGSRDKTYRRFQNEHANGDAGIVVLLVDSETPVGESGPANHLAMHDRWGFVGVDDDMIHLMVQTMEAWIVADLAALRGYYGQGLRENALPRRQNLEEEGKGDIARALTLATQGTQKGKYHKIKHAGHLLQHMDPMTVRQRCLHCARPFQDASPPDQASRLKLRIRDIALTVSRLSKAWCPVDGVARQFEQLQMNCVNHKSPEAIPPPQSPY